MSEKALARVTSGAIVSPIRVDATAIDLTKLCEHLAKSGYFGNAADVSKAMVKVLYGAELGLPPVASMMGVHIIEGKPAPSSNLLAAIVKRSGVYNYRVLQNTDQVCEIAFTENGKEIGRTIWTIQDAGRAELAGKGTWKKYPRQMLFSRCLAEGVRTHCPDLCGGAPVYTPDELGAEVDGETGDLRQGPAYVSPGGVPANEHGEVIDVTARVTAAAEQQPSHAAATVSGGDHGPRGRFWAGFKAHFGDCPDEIRYFILNALLKPKVPINSQSGWDDRRWTAAADKIAAHAHPCGDGSDCALMREALAAYADSHGADPPDDPFDTDEGATPAGQHGVRDSRKSVWTDAGAPDTTGDEGAVQ